MAPPTPQQIFGTGFTQTPTTFTIAKADLPGLTASASNSGGQLFAALVLKAKTQLTRANQESNPDQSITIEDGFESLETRLSIQYRQNSLTVNLQKPDASTGIDPDDY